MLLAKEDVQSLRQLLSVALRNGTSPSTILHQLQCSIDGKYSPRSQFSERDLAVEFLAKSLGGPRLLYALSKDTKYPSVATVSRKYHIPCLIPSISAPTRVEISDNITIFFGSTGKAAPSPPSFSTPPSIPRAGHILMIDGVALNEVCRYDAARNRILGLCRELDW